MHPKVEFSILVFCIAIPLIIQRVEPTGVAEIAKTGKEVLEKTVKMMTHVKELLGPEGIHIENLAPLVSTLGAVLGVLGPGVSIAALIIDICILKKKEDEAKKQFGLLHKRFDEIDEKLGAISNKIQVQGAYAEYKKDILDKKHQLQLASKDLQDCPDPKTVQVFTDACKKHEPLALLNKIQNVLVKNHLGLTTLFDAFYTSANFDRKYIHERVYFVLVDLIEVGILAQVCSHMEGNMTQAYADLVGKKVQTNAEQIVAQLKTLDQRLSKEFHPLAQKELTELLKNQAAKPDALSIIKNMTSKYNWLNFYINVYKEKKDDTYASSKVYDTSKTWFIEVHNKGQPSAVMAWTDKANSNKNVAILVKTHTVIDQAAKDEKCSTSAKAMIANLDAYPFYTALKPKWVYVIYDPASNELSKQNAHGAVADIHACDGKQDIIIGFD